MVGQGDAVLPTPQPLRVSWRLVAGGAAVVLATFSVLAIFRTRNDLGATALLVVATYLWLISMLGRVPRLKFGDNEMDPYYAGYARGTVDGTSDGASEVREAVETAARDALPVLDEPTAELPSEKTSGLDERPDLAWVRDVPRELVDAARQAELEARTRAIKRLLLRQLNETPRPRPKSLDEWRRLVWAFDHPVAGAEVAALMQDLPGSANVATANQEIRHQQRSARARSGQGRADDHEGEPTPDSGPAVG